LKAERLNSEYLDRVIKLITETSYQHLPRQAIYTAKSSILDCLGVSLAGCNQKSSKIINDYVRDEQSKPEAGVIGGGFKTSAALAAWANGTKAHALDYDDVSLPVHPTVAILPAILAVAERYHFTGKDILLSYIVGFEVEMSLRFSGKRHVEQGWHVTSTWGSMGAAAAVAKILGLDAKKTRMTLGIAASLAGGLRKNFGTMTKPLHAGNASRNGVVAAMLAQLGFTADKDILSSSLGFFEVFGKGAEHDEQANLELGDELHIVSHGIGIKPYPSCAATHWAIQATLDLKKNYGMNPADVIQIQCRTSSGIPQILIHHHPKTALEGKFSLEFCVAIALLDGEVTLSQFTDERVRDPAVKELMSRVKYAHPTEMGTSLAELSGEVVVKLRNGKIYSCQVDIARGDPRNPLGWDEICSKYRDCVSQALSPSDIKHSIALISDLDSVADVSHLMDIFTFMGNKE
jgi:2-methylcitrate dehydratase PrpD